ncbi:MAG: VOC family protein [Pyrinomonadaceae bacterium]
MTLPVASVDKAVPFYESIMGFTVVERSDSPNKRAVLERDDIKIGLEENGEDSSQAGVAFEVDNVEAAHAEFKGNGLAVAGDGPRDPNGTISAEINAENQNGVEWNAFYIVAPDELCYWIGERQTQA